MNKISWLKIRSLLKAIPIIFVGLLLNLSKLSAAEVDSSEQETTWDGVYTEQQAERGLELVVQHCAGCHGKTMRGGTGAPPMAGIELLFIWDQQPLEALFNYMKSNMPPGNIVAISDQQYVDILAAMLKSSGYPASLDKELSVYSGQLAKVLIKREKNNNDSVRTGGKP